MTISRSQISKQVEGKAKWCERREEEKTKSYSCYET